MKLESKVSRDLTLTTPFNFDPTFYKPDHFTSGDNLWESGTRWQTWKHGSLSLGLKFKNTGTVNRPRIELSIYSRSKLDKETLDSLVREVRFRYNLDLDLSDFYRQFSNHKVLGPMIKELYGMRPGHPSSLYEYLIIGVVLQNATVRRSIQMFKALLEKYGEEVEFDNQKLWCFWQPGRLRKVTVDDLRALKVGYRAKYIKKIDDQFDQGLIDEIDLRGEDAEIQRTELLKLYGVGPATVWYLLFDVFHHWELFDHISPWEQKIYSKIFFDRDPENPLSAKKLLGYINKFREYKHLAVHYIWEDLWWKYKTDPPEWLKKQVRV